MVNTINQAVEITFSPFPGIEPGYYDKIPDSIFIARPQEFSDEAWDSVVAGANYLSNKFDGMHEETIKKMGNNSKYKTYASAYNNAIYSFSFAIGMAKRIPDLSPTHYAMFISKCTDVICNFPYKYFDGAESQVERAEAISHLCNVLGVFVADYNYRNFYTKWISDTLFKIYFIDLYVVKDSSKAIVVEDDIISFTLGNRRKALGSWMGKEPGDITPSFDFEEKRI